MKTLLVIAVLSIPLTSNAFFDQLSKKEIRSLIGNFPASGSAEELNDDQILLNYQNTRTKADCVFAASQSSFKAEKIFAVPIGPLEKREYDRVEGKVRMLSAKVGLNVSRAKDMYNRKRPYERNSEIKPCIHLENSSSYPSGHTASGRAIGLLLAEFYPEKSNEILEVANQVGINRIIGGVHHPSDVEAGKKLGQEVARRVLLDKILEEE